MSKYFTKSGILIFIIFALAFAVRIYNLGNIPYGFHVDEVKAGWNAFSILQTGHDDKGNLLPTYYDSFGDFRPAGLIYLIIPSIFLFGNTVFAVRLPFALIGALTVVPMFLFVFELSKRRSTSLPLFSSMLLGLNPWHIVISRSTSESIVALFLTLFGLFFFIKIFRTNRVKDMIFSVVLFVFSFCFYHSIRILAPLFLLMVAGFYQFVLSNKINRLQIVGFIFVSFCSVLVFLTPESRGRMSQVSLKSDFQILYEVTKMPTEEGPGQVLIARIFHNRLSSYFRRFAEEYKEYFGTNYLVGNNQKPVRYFVPYIGLMTYLELLFIVCGLFFVSKRLELLLVLGLLLISPFPAAVTNEDTPNIVRSIFMLPFLLVLGSYGIEGIRQLGRKWWYIFWLLLVVYFLNFIYFCHMYLVHQKMSIASYYRNGGNIELVSELKKISSNYSRIVLTNTPDNLYPWVAFGLYNLANDFNSQYRTKVDEGNKVDKFIFSKYKCPLNSLLDNGLEGWNGTLFVDAEGCVLDDKFSKLVKVNLVKVISRPDNSPPFYLRTVVVLK